MKATGIVRPVDELGRIVLPKELRRTMGIGSNDPLEIFADDDAIVLRKYQPGCIFCGEAGDTLKMSGKLVCIKCARIIAGSIRT